MRTSGEADPRPGIGEAGRQAVQSHVRALRPQPSGAHGAGTDRPRRTRVRRFLREDPRQVRERRRRVRDLQAGRRFYPGVDRERRHPRRWPRRPPGYQRPLPRQHATGRHVLRRPPRPGRRTQSRSARRPRRDRQEVQPVLQDHGRTARRLVRSRQAPASRHLGTARRGRVREWTRVRQGPAYRQVVRRLHLVQVRRPGFGRVRHPRREPVQGRPVSPQDEVRRLGVRPRMRRGRGQGLWHDRDRERVQPVRRRQRRSHARPRPAPRRRHRRGYRPQVPRPIPHVLHPHGRQAGTYRSVAGQAPVRQERRRTHRAPQGGHHRGLPRHLRRARPKDAAPRRYVPRRVGRGRQGSGTEEEVQAVRQHRQEHPEGGHGGIH
mmetsp:Transcript_29636/g.55096  ORF Transcript_29636/g.55096 Transcript_29636/m.55096 type:complete len:378 (+) Transcript_29636:795-1928(+)